MRLGARSAWLVSLPLLILVGGAVLLPFGWRAWSLAQDCLQGASCAVSDLVSDDYYLQALTNTLWLAGLSSLLGLAGGLGAAIALAEMPRWRSAVSLLASLGANFSGVPLGVALLLLLGAQGLLRLALQALGLPLPLSLDSLGGLLLAYLCFQLPLATLLLMAPVQMLEGGLMDAAATLGAGPARFWLRVGMPLLMPSLLEAFALLFANAAAAFATPFALSGTAANVLSIRIAALVSGDIFAQPELSALLALLLFVLLVVVIGLCRLLAHALRRRWS